MRRGTRGSVLALGLLLTIAVLIATRLFSDLLAAVIASEKAQTAADFALLSALRIRAQSLEAVAARWELFGAPLANADGMVEAPAGTVPSVALAADALRRSLSGFQGRVSSALTVAAEANGADRALVAQTVPNGLRLGIEPQSAPLNAPGFPAVSVDALWYRRAWASRADAGPAGIRVGWRIPRAGGTWEWSASAAGHLSWDGNTADPVVDADGNGGFSPDWASASTGAAFRPHRVPVFRAEPGALAP